MDECTIIPDLYGLSLQHLFSQVVQNVASTFSTKALTDILLYHVVSGEATSTTALTLLGYVPMANSKLAGLKYFDGSIYVNDDSKVIIPDIDAAIGVIHVIETVILGPWPRAAE